MSPLGSAFAERDESTTAQLRIPARSSCFGVFLKSKAQEVFELFGDFPSCSKTLGNILSVFLLVFYLRCPKKDLEELLKAESGQVLGSDSTAFLVASLGQQRLVRNGMKRLGLDTKIWETQHIPCKYHTGGVESSNLVEFFGDFGLEKW